MLKTLYAFRSTVGGHEAKRLHSKLKKCRGWSRRYTDEPTNVGSNRGLLRLGDNVSNQWR